MKTIYLLLTILQFLTVNAMEQLGGRLSSLTALPALPGPNSQQLQTYRAPIAYDPFLEINMPLLQQFANFDPSYIRVQYADIMAQVIALRNQATKLHIEFTRKMSGITAPQTNFSTACAIAQVQSDPPQAETSANTNVETEEDPIWPQEALGDTLSSPLPSLPEFSAILDSDQDPQLIMNAAPDSIEAPQDANVKTDPALKTSDNDLKDIQYICKFCRMTIVGYENLYQHNLVLHKKKFSCTECGYGSTGSGTMASHMYAVHNREKRCKCKYCGSSFAYHSPVLKHEMKCTKNPANQLFCQECHRTFLTRKIFEAHMARHQSYCYSPV